MLDTGEVIGSDPRQHAVSPSGRPTAVDLNADLGESETVTRSDLAILATVTSANVACGFHAGSRRVMRATAEAARARQVAIGAHVSYRDRAGFGRRRLDLPTDQLLADLVEQITDLVDEVAAAGGAVQYVKPHGALYNVMAVDRQVADVVVEAVRWSGAGILVAQPGTVAAEQARRSGLTVVAEAFPDRGYQADGRLVPRQQPGALVTDPAEVARRAVSLVTRGGVRAIDGSWVAVAADTLCVHGDSPNAAAAAVTVRQALDAAGVTVRSFVPSLPPAPSAAPR